ncbi:MAG: Rpn family recombination-promoting nuclease/putative transposase [Mariprofundales bacterium]
MCYINPRIDFAFKKLFGSEENKDLLISLINSIVGEEDQVVDIELKNPYNLADYQSGKISILDIKAVDASGRWFNVEMQVNQDLDFDKRAIYYWSKLVTEQLSEGVMFRELRKTISINILGFNYVENNDGFHSIYQIMNVETGASDRLHDLFELHYIELKKFTKTYSEIASALDRWATFLTRAHDLKKESLPIQLQSDTAVVKAVHAVDRMFDEDERKVYEVRMQAIAQIESSLASERAHALETGFHDGREEGLQEGRQEGSQQAIRQMVWKAHESGMGDAEIARIFSMDLLQIEDILKHECE